MKTKRFLQILKKFTIHFATINTKNYKEELKRYKDLQYTLLLLIPYYADEECQF